VHFILTCILRRHIWTASLEVDPNGNFVYIGGGIENTTGNISSSSGWLAMAYLGNRTGPSRGDSDASSLSIINKVEVSNSPIQELVIQNDTIVTGGGQSCIKYWSRSTLGI
jgi:hypothetical protein